MKSILVIALLATACGNSSVNNEIVGQVKRVINKTPLVCPDYIEADISLGVMRNGIGSMSHEDVMLAVEPANKDAIDRLKWAAENGAIVKASYDVRRVSPCWPDHRLIGKVTFEAVPSGTSDK